MPIKVYPVKIEAVDEDNELAFTLEAFDECMAQIDIKTLLGEDNIEDVIAAIRQALALLELKKSS